MSFLLSYMHPSWFKVARHSELIRLLLDRSHENPYLERYLHEEYGLSLGMEEKPEISDDSLMALVRLGGLAMNYEKVKSLLSNELQRKLLDIVGEAYYRFALDRGPFLAKSSLSDFCPLYDHWDTLDHLEEHLLHSGLRCLALALGADSELRKLIFLKLPHQYSATLIEDDSFTEINTSENQQRARSFMTKISKEVSVCHLFSA